MSRTASKQAAIDMEAADWLAAIECGTADRQAFEHWRAGDPARALAFIRLSQVSRDLDSLRETGLSALSPAAEASSSGPAKDRRQFLMLGGVGLVAAAMGGLGWTYAAAAREAETAVGERRRMVIADGVALELNTDSRVTWRRADGVYEIDLLRGEVMLERQPGSAPCRLYCGKSQVDLAGGGRINARSGPHGLALTVLEGVASLRTPAAPTAVHLAPLHEAKVVAGAPPTLSPLSQSDAGTVSAWQQGQLRLNGENLAEAVAEYNRYLSRPLVIADPSIGQIRLGGRFSTTDPDEFCAALKEIYGVTAHFETDRIRLTRS